MANKDIKSEQMLEPEFRNVSSTESTPIHVEEHKDNTFTFEIKQSDKSMASEPGVMSEAAMPAGSRTMKDEKWTAPIDAVVSPKKVQHEMSSIMGDFTGFCPSAVPTPLMGNHPTDMMDHPPPLPPLPPALPSSTISMSDRPDPQSIITHFDIVHHHMERSAVNLHQSLAISMDEMMAIITKKIDESVRLAKSDDAQRNKNINALMQEVVGLKKPIDSLALKVDEIDKATVRLLNDKLQTVIHVNAKINKTIEAMAAKIGELEKKLESVQEGQHARQLQVHKELRELLHHQRPDTPLESHLFSSANDHHGSAQTALQHSPTHLHPLGTAASASASAPATAVRTTSTAPSFPSIAATVSWPAYNYNYNYNYPTTAAFPLSRQQFQQMDPQSRRAYVADHALQLTSPDISQHPAFALNGVNGSSSTGVTFGSGSAGDYYEQGYEYGAR